MNKLSMLLWIQVIDIAVALDYETRCPAVGEWRFRGEKFHCGSTQYVCLLHTALNTFHENCDGLDYSSTGSKLIFEPFFNKALCSYNRYQPFPFSTDGNSECVFKKSTCNEKGQYIFHKGSLTSDTTCGCDLSSGYEFVSSPKHNCYCIPSEEDCSCYKLLCYDKDEQCPHDNEVVKDKRLTDDTLITSLDKDRFNEANYNLSDLENGKKLRILCMYITTVLLATMIVFVSSIYVLEMTLQRITSSEALIGLEGKYSTRCFNITKSKTSEKRYSVTVMIMGKSDVEKTLLLRRLLHEKHDNHDYLPKFDGVEIFDTKWKINKDTGKWTINKELTINTTNLIKEAGSRRTDDNRQIQHAVPSDSNMNNTQNAACRFWNFAGKKEIYAVHQAFLRRSAIYLVVADINEDIGDIGLRQNTDDFDNIGGYVDFWFNTIHSYGTVDQRVSELFSQYLNPPVIMVFTGTESIRKTQDGKIKLRKRKQELNTQLLQVFEGQNTIHHLRNVFYLSNTTEHDKEFENLRQVIFRTARNMEHWGERFPANWINLEKQLLINRINGKDVMTISDMNKVASDKIQDKRELVLFLRFQHEKGNILFFDGIEDLIIFNPNYLIDAVRCLITNNNDDKRMTKSLITTLFESKERFSKQADMLMKVMEKNDILVKINSTPEYLMPSMLLSTSFDKIFNSYGNEMTDCKRTSWLCLTFESLPPSFFYHVCAWFVHNYESDKGKNNLFRGIYICEIVECDLSYGKILLTTSTDTIAVQFFTEEKNEKKSGSIINKIKKDLITTVTDIKMRYKLKLSYKIFTCSSPNFVKDTRLDLKALKNNSSDPLDFTDQCEDISLPWVIDEEKVQ